MRRWLSLAALATALLIGGCAGLGLDTEPIEVNLANLTPLPGGAFEQRLQVDLRLRNPNDRAYEIEGLRFVLEVNGQRLASGVSDASATLPRLGEVVVPVTTTTTLLDLLGQVAALGRRDRSAATLEYSLRGRIFLANSWRRLEFERSGTLGEVAAGP